MPLLLNQSQKGSYRDDRRRNDRHDQLWMDCGPYGSGPKHGTYRRRSADFRSFIISIDAFSKGAGGYSNNWPAFLFQRRVADRLQVRLSAHADALREAFLGTLAPLFRASDSPIAIACFLLVTFFPVPGEFVLMRQSASGITHDSVTASDNVSTLPVWTSEL